MRHRPVFWMAMVAIAILGGCARKPDDAALVKSIASQVQADPLLKDAELGVNSNNGEVTLSGTVGSDAARGKVYKIAAQTSGVVKVNDQMSVEVAQAGPETAPIVVSAGPSAPASLHNRREKKKGESAVEEMKATETAAASQNSAPMQMHGTIIPAAPQPASSQLAPIAVQTSVQAPALPTPPSAPPAPPQPRDVVVPVSSMMRVRMIDAVDSAVNHPGEIFHAALESPMMVDGTVVVPRGTDIYVRLASSKKAGRLKGKSELHLELLKMDFQGRSYSLYSSTYTATGTSKGKETAKKVGGGAAIGAIIGAIAGAGAGAAIGAGVGAGTGAVMTGLTKGKQVKIPSEAMLDFELEQPVTVTVLPRPTLASAAQ
jgi:BON domain-containing protein